MTLSQFDREHIDEILKDDNGSGGGERYSNFDARLIRLIAHADYHNRELLHRVYPDVVEAYTDWWHGQRGYADTTTTAQT